MDNGDASDLPAEPTAITIKTPLATPDTDTTDTEEHARFPRSHEKNQAQQQARRRSRHLEKRERREWEKQQGEQAERERLAREQLLAAQYHNHSVQQVHDLGHEILAMRGQYERDQMMLEQYDLVSFLLLILL